MEQKRVATEKRSGEWQRIEESRFAMELHGIDLNDAAKAMDARRRIDKQRHSAAQKRKSTAKNRNDRLRH